MATFTHEEGKDPDAVLDYGIDWEPWLAGLTIVTSTWAIDNAPDASLVIDSDSNNTTVASVVLSGGTIGQQYQVRNRITTAQWTDDRTILMPINEK